MIEYFTRVRDDILQHAKPTCFEDLTVFDLLSFMGSKGYQNGIGLMSAEERTAAGNKGYENSIGLMSAEERTAAGKKGYENSIGLMLTEERTAACNKGGRKSIRCIAWTADLDDAIVRMIGDSFSYKDLASELGNGLNKNDIVHRWHNHLKKSSGIIKPHIRPGFKSCIT